MTGLPSPVLAIETTSPEGSVALLVDGRVAGREDLGAGTRHGRELHPAAARLLGAAGLAPRDLRLVVVGLGPGSFTGMRVGLAAARTLAFATGASLVGVPSFDALAAAVAEDAAHVAVARDARRDDVWFSLHGPAGADGGRPTLRAARRVPLRDAAALVPTGAAAVGDAAAALADAAPGRGIRVADPPGDRAPADLLALLGARRFAAEGPGDPDAIAPLYLHEGVGPPRAPAPR